MNFEISDIWFEIFQFIPLNHFSKIFESCKFFLSLRSNPDIWFAYRRNIFPQSLKIWNSKITEKSSNKDNEFLLVKLLNWMEFTFRKRKKSIRERTSYVMKFLNFGCIYDHNSCAIWSFIFDRLKDPIFKNLMTDVQLIDYLDFRFLLKPQNKITTNNEFTNSNEYIRCITYHKLIPNDEGLEYLLKFISFDLWKKIFDYKQHWISTDDPPMPMEDALKENMSNHIYSAFRTNRVDILKYFWENFSDKIKMPLPFTMENFWESPIFFIKISRSKNEQILSYFFSNIVKPLDSIFIKYCNLNIHYIDMAISKGVFPSWNFEEWPDNKGYFFINYLIFNRNYKTISDLYEKGLLPSFERVKSIKPITNFNHPKPLEILSNSYSEGLITDIQYKNCYKYLMTLDHDPINYPISLENNKKFLLRKKHINEQKLKTKRWRFEYLFFQTDKLWDNYSDDISTEKNFHL